MRSSSNIRRRFYRELLKVEDHKCGNTLGEGEVHPIGTTEQRFDYLTLFPLPYSENSNLIFCDTEGRK